VASSDDQPDRLRRDHEPLLDDRVIEAIARRVTDLLRQDPASMPEGGLVSAAEIARRFGVSRAWVYENADRLGAVRLGRGERPRLRFDPRLVEQRLDSTDEGASPRPQRVPDDGGAIAQADLIPLRRL
jgi:hypothetical protein